jgi:arsenate reductase
MGNKASLMFLCTGNSCRSQMAEGLCRHRHGESIDVASAGIETHGLNPLAVRAMAEIGIDITGHASKTVESLDDTAFDVVITVCGHADESCPVFPGRTQVIHHGFDDPPKLAADAADDDAAMVHYRRVRDEIRDYVEHLPGILASLR